MTDDDIRRLPGIKRRDLKRCAMCDRGVAERGDLTFYRVSIEHFVLDARAIQRRHGLETFFGGGGPGAALAEVMGGDEDLAKRLGDPAAGILCMHCAMHGGPVAVVTQEIAVRAKSATEGAKT